MILTDLFESQEIHNQDRLDSVLGRCIELIHEKNQANPKKYGKVAACIIDMKNRKVFGINSPGPDGTRRHAERMAIDAYHKRYGKILPGAIIVTTLSPCNRDMLERDGASCQDLLLQVGIEKVYSGYMDPSQHSDHPFTEETTQNDDMWRQCKELSDSFVHDDLTESEHHGMDADQVLDYVKRAHAPEAFDIEYSITDHPKWELKTIPLSQLNLDPDGETQDPYNRVNWVDYDKVQELIPRIESVLKRMPIVVDSEGWIIDGNHRAMAAAEAGLTSVPAYVPVNPVVAEGLDPDKKYTIKKSYTMSKAGVEKSVWYIMDGDFVVDATDLRRDAKYYADKWNAAEKDSKGVAEGVYRGDWVRHPDNPWQIGQIQSIDNGQAAVIWKKTDKRKKAMSSTHAVDALQHARREFSQLTQPTHTPGMAEGKQPGQPVVDAILKVMPVAQEIWFHGSRATGKHRRNSDTDILVVVPDDLVGAQYLGVVRILQKLSSHLDNYDIQPTKAGTNIHRIAQEEGRLLWSNKQDMAEGLDDNGISFKVQKGKNKFATTLSMGNNPVGVYQYNATTGRSIAEVYPEFKGKGLGKLLVLHAIYTATQLGLDFQEDESRTSEYDNVLDSLSSNGYIVDDDGYWYVTGEGEQYLKQSLKQDVAENFHDGKNPGRKGLAKRSGVNTKASVSSLRKTAKNSSGEKQRMAHWLANMKAGRAKARKK